MKRKALHALGLLRFQRSITSDVLRALEDLREIRDQLKLFRENADISKRLLTAENDAFKKGHSSRTTLEQVQKDYIVSKLDLAMGHIREMLMRFEIDVVTGELRKGIKSTLD